MKTRLATILSLTGVLVAGSAAALVNTQVLDGGGGSTASAADVVETTTTGAPADTVESSTTSTTTTTMTAAPAPQAQQASASVSTQAAYQIGEAGTVTLDTQGDVLTIVDVTPAAGWTVTKSANTDPRGVKVVFRAGDVEVEFEAKLVSGVVVTSVHSSRLGATNPTVAPTGATYHGDDDDHDDDSADYDERDDHEEEDDD